MATRKYAERVRLAYVMEKPDRIEVTVSNEGTLEEVREDVLSQIRDGFLPYRLRISREVRSALVVRICGSTSAEYRKAILDIVNSLTRTYYREVQLA